MPKPPLNWKTFKGGFPAYVRATAAEGDMTYDEALKLIRERKDTARQFKDIAGAKTIKPPRAEPKARKKVKAAPPPQDELPGLFKSEAYRAGFMEKLAQHGLGV